MKNQTKEKTWGAVAILSFVIFIVALSFVIATFVIAGFILTNIFFVGLLVFVAAVMFYTAIQKADFYSCFRDSD